MQTNFRTSGIRSILYVGKSFTTQGDSTQHTIRFRNSGRKRTGIWGYAWNMDDFHNETSSGLTIFFHWTISEYAPNRKVLTSNIGRVPLQWLNTAVDVPRDLHGAVMFPVPIIAKNFDLMMQSNLYTGTMAGAPRMWVYVSDIELLDDMGDYTHSTNLNRGWARCKIIGQTKMTPEKKQGWV